MKKLISIFTVFAFLLLPLTAYASSSYSNEISSVMTNFTLNNYSCNSAVQQAVNGNYRAVEMLDIIARELDTKGTYSSDISSIMTNFTLNNYS